MKNIRRFIIPLLAMVACALLAVLLTTGPEASKGVTSTRPERPDVLVGAIHELISAQIAGNEIALMQYKRQVELIVTTRVAVVTLCQQNVQFARAHDMKPTGHCVGLLREWNKVQRKIKKERDKRRF